MSEYDEMVALVEGENEDFIDMLLEKIEGEEYLEATNPKHPDDWRN